jgi:hypothetical protein
MRQLMMILLLERGSEYERVPLAGARVEQTAETEV